jgi:hypothetical protein
MEFIGREPTEQEKKDILAPYGVNSGEEWSLESIRDYVNAGHAAVKKNSQVNAAIERGIKMLKTGSEKG